MMTTAQDENLLAKDHGFEAVKDVIRGDDWCYFRKGTLTVWSVVNGWVSAHLKDDGYYRDHQAHKTLADALRRK